MTLIMRSLLRRAVILDKYHDPRRTSCPKVSTTVNLNPEGLEILSLDTTFSYRWLRDACTCPACIHPSTQQKLHRTSDIPASIAPEHVETTDDGIHILWAGVDRHRSFFPRAHLAACASPTAIQSFHHDVPPQLWPTSSALLTTSGGDLEVSYADLSAPRGLLRAITQLQRTGLLFLHGVPCADISDSGCEIRTLAARLAEIRETFYGAVWNVKNVTESRNIAYTNVFLGLHMDLQYFESPPRFQILHCLRNRVQGGTSLFVDSFAAAEMLRATHPADFARLVTTPVPFQYINDSRHLRHERPTIILDPAAPADAAARITAVSYSPPFQAPLLRDTPPEFYDALARFAALVDAPAAVFARRLGEGDAVVFDNRRVLHGRTSFEDGSGNVGDAGGEPNRWLKGCYFEGDVMASHGRTLRARAARGEI
ncbi:hypothetical protein F5148DRAFT_1151385 [Russula earlei]|uniref:Uncharacterized protein n=1 Tax=Russula earlei TaxID=71964 RepID=A0ACC0U0Y1_9AGAM|nr:hypothetical protein F5148DRAFT_1151385 [Russula earlei]